MRFTWIASIAIVLHCVAEVSSQATSSTPTSPSSSSLPSPPTLNNTTTTTTTPVTQSNSTQNATVVLPATVGNVTCVDRFKPSGEPQLHGTYTDPRAVSKEEWATFSAQLAVIAPSTVMQDAWEAEMNPQRLVGKTKSGLTCIGCENPLAKKTPAEVKLAITTEYDAGRPFMRMESCLRKISATCNIFCFEWGIKASAKPDKPKVEKVVEQVVQKALHTFPTGPREPNSLPEYTLPPLPPAPPAPEKWTQYKPLKGQVRDTVQGITDNTCRCSCKTTNTTMDSSDPYACKCFCPSQNGEMGEVGIQGLAGARGPRGLVGRPGIPGPIGLMGSMPSGNHVFESCECIHEDLTYGKNGQIVLGCQRDGFVIAGFKRSDCNGIDCIITAKCCQPCLKIVGALPPSATVTYATRYTSEASKEGQDVLTFSNIWRDAKAVSGFCKGPLPAGVFNINNRNFCRDPRTGVEGVGHDLAVKVTMKFYPHVNKKWSLRVSADFSRGSVILLDGKEWLNRAGKAVASGGRWDGDILLTPPATLAANQWHTIQIIGLDETTDSPMNAQINYGAGWLTVSPGTLESGCV